MEKIMQDALHHLNIEATVQCSLIYTHCPLRSLHEEPHIEEQLVFRDPLV